MKNRDQKLDELLDYLHGCAEDPAALEAELAQSAELRALLEEMRETQELLQRAARGPANQLDLDVPAPGPTPTRRPWRLAAAAAVLLFVGVPALRWGLAELRAHDVEASAWRLVASGPTYVPDGAPASVRAQIWDVNGDPLPAAVSWSVYDVESGDELETGEAETDGTLDVTVAAALDRPRRVELVAFHGGVERKTQLGLSPQRDNPLVHLSSDKPAYRPGETIWLRALLMKRLSLEARDGNCRARLIDPKGAPVLNSVQQLEEGVAAFQWTVPEGAAGGEYVFELRDAQDTFTVERLPLLVRHYQAPRLAQTIDLDRETYAPGESGAAELTVERVEGGIPAGASVSAGLVLDGAEVWSEEATLDGEGRAVFRFTVPMEVERGEARFVCRTTDGGILETALEPFVVPTGELEVAFYPEGGDLVAGMTQRVYAEVSDPLGRPTSARGRILDSSGAEVTRFETLHQGRARFELEPRRGESYTLEFDEPEAESVQLPGALASGVALRAAADTTQSDEALSMSVATPDTGPWIAGVFCRGVLVAQDAFEGQGEHTLSFPLPEDLAGVLRVTVFDAALQPAAERLVHRTSERAIEITVAPDEDVLLPGGHQGLQVTTRDETGRPVSCVLGVSVFDRAVADMVGEHRIGLADQTWLVAEVEELEDVEEFLLGDEDAARNVDLLLGTRGWRRFAWFDADTVIADNGEAAKRLMLREGRPQVPAVDEARGDGVMLLATARSAAHQARGQSIRFALGTLAVGLVILLVRWLSGLTLVRRRVVLVPAAALALVVTLVFYAAWSVQIGGSAREDAPAAFAERVAAIDYLDPAVLEQLAALGYDGGGEERKWLIDHDGLVAFGANFAADGKNQLAAVNGEVDLFRFEAQAGEVPMLAFAVQNEAGPAGPAAPAQQEIRRLRQLGYDAKDEANAGAFFLGRGEMRMAGKPSVAYARVYAHKNARHPEAPRTDFAETVYWNALLKTAPDGTARMEFDLSDRVTTWKVVVDAHGAGRVGQGEGSFEAVTPFRLEAKLPVELTQGDELRLPIALTSGSERIREARLRYGLEGPMIPSVFEEETLVELRGGRGRHFVPFTVTEPGELKLRLRGTAGGWNDGIEQSFQVVPRGFPQFVSKSGLLKDEVEFSVALPDDYVGGSLEVGLQLYPSPLADLLAGLDGLLQEPHGCFEQASSANYPNLLALAYLEAAGADAPAAAARARDLLDRGYAKITGYECSERGYEWFGGDPGHEALTAYGLLEFHDMAGVYDVDLEMVARTRAWLLGRRDGDGGYERNDRALDSFGRAPQETTDAYVTYALAVTGEEPANIESELDRLESRALESDDPYEVALAACALQAAGRVEPADAARERLKELQEEDGSLLGTASITRSGGRDLAVETTSFAILAWLEDEGDGAHVQRAVEFLVASRDGRGRFGATQATIQALRALTAYAADQRRVANPGEVQLFVNDYPVETLAFAAGRKEGLVFDALASAMKPGTNRIRLELTGDNEFPWSFEARYTADQPADDPDATVAITTGLADESVEEGKTVALTATVENLTDAGQPMTLAVIGLPAGLEVPTKVLEDLLEAERFDLWELREREVVLYWRDLAPRETCEVTLDLVARIPGTTTGPASRAYLYYTPQAKRWSEPLTIAVE